jgi:hypothetical protein
VNPSPGGNAWTADADCWILRYERKPGLFEGRAWQHGTNVYLAAVACFVLAAACSFVGVAIRRKQGGQSTGEARLAAARFRFAMLSGVVFSLAEAALMFSTLLSSSP